LPTLTTSTRNCASTRNCKIKKSRAAPGKYKEKKIFNTTQCKDMENLEVRTKKCSKCGRELPASEFYAKKYAPDGARRRINSVWHDASEMPNGHEKCLVELRFPGKKNPRYFLWTRGWENSFVTRWAYLSDLLPERKEETE